MTPFAKRWGGLLLVAFLVPLLALSVSPVLNPPKWDEYIIVYDSHRLLQGQVPYRDFFNIIPPGIFFFLAAIFSLAGSSSLTIARWASAGLMLGATLAASRSLAERGWGKMEATLWAFVPAVCLFPFWAVPSHHWLAYACFAAELAVLAGPLSGRWPGLFLAGLVAGICGLAVQTQGIALALLAAVYLLLSPERRFKRLAEWASGLCLVWVPFFGFLAWSGAFGGFLRDCLLWPMASYSRGDNENAGPVLQDLPWRVGDIWTRFRQHPGFWSFVVSAAGGVLYALLSAVGIGLVVLGAWLLARSLRRRRLEDPWAAAAMACTFLWTGLALRGNLNWIHFVFYTASLLPVWLVAMGSPEARRRGWRTASRCLLGALLVSGVLYHSRGLFSRWPEGWEFVDADRPIREQAVNRFLRSPGVLSPGDTVAAFPEGGEVYLYCAPSAVRFTYFKPLVQQYHSIEDHALAARDIEARKPRWILFPPDLEAAYLDPRSAVAELIRRDYQRRGVIGNAVMYERKEG
jgi:hypothetical protein